MAVGRRFTRDHFFNPCPALQPLLTHSLFLFTNTCKSTHPFSSPWLRPHCFCCCRCSPSPSPCSSWPSPTQARNYIYIWNSVSKLSDRLGNSFSYSPWQGWASTAAEQWRCWGRGRLCAWTGAWVAGRAGWRWWRSREEEARRRKKQGMRVIIWWLGCAGAATASSNLDPSHSPISMIKL